MSRAASYTKAARALLHRQEEVALREADSALAESPADPRVFFLKCRILYRWAHYTDLRRTLDAFSRARAEKLGQGPYGTFCFYLARTCQYNARFLTALDMLDEALAAFRATGNVRYQIETLLAQCDVCSQMHGDYYKAGHEALAQARRFIVGLHPGPRMLYYMGKYRGFKGRLFQLQGDFRKALDHFCANREIALNLGDKNTAMLLAIHMAGVHTALGDCDSAERELGTVTKHYLRTNPKVHLYFSVQQALIALGKDDKRSARRIAKSTLKRAGQREQTDLLHYRRIADLLQKLGEKEQLLSVCRFAIRYVENSRRRLKTPRDMRQFRESWSVFYQLAIGLLIEENAPLALTYHVMNQSRTLFDLVTGFAGCRVQTSAGQKEETLDAIERSLKGDRGGKALNEGAVRKMLNVVVNSSPGSIPVLTTWHNGNIAFMYALRKGTNLRAIPRIDTFPLANPNTSRGRRIAQEAFVSLLPQLLDGASPMPRIIIIPDDLTRRVAFHTVDMDGVPAFARVPIAYHLSLPLLAQQCVSTKPRASGKVDLAAVYDANDPRIKAYDEARRVADLCKGAFCRARRPRVLSCSSILDAFRGNDIVHIASHHLHDPRHNGIGAIPATDKPVTALDLLGGEALRARFVSAAMCESARTRSSVFNEPLGLLSALLLGGVRGVVATRAPISGEESCEWMTELYSRFVGQQLYPDFCNAYFETMRAMLDKWGSRERVGKFVYYGI